MNVKTSPRGRELYHTILGWVVIITMIAAIGAFLWAKHYYNAERRLGGTWSYDAASRHNAGGAGEGTRLVFSGKNITVLNGTGQRIYSFDWTTHRYSTIDDVDFPIGLSLMKTENELDGFASMKFSSDDARMLFAIFDSGDSPTRFAEFRRQP